MNIHSLYVDDVGAMTRPLDERLRALAERLVTIHGGLSSLRRTLDGWTDHPELRQWLTSSEGVAAAARLRWLRKEAARRVGEVEASLSQEILREADIERIESMRPDESFERRIAELLSVLEAETEKGRALRFRQAEIRQTELRLAELGQAEQERQAPAASRRRVRGGVEELQLAIVALACIIVLSILVALSAGPGVALLFAFAGCVAVVVWRVKRGQDQVSEPTTFGRSEATSKVSGTVNQREAELELCLDQLHSRLLRSEISESVYGELRESLVTRFETGAEMANSGRDVRR